MRKTTTRSRSVKPKRKIKSRRKALKIFDGWHLYGSVPGMDEWAMNELKRRRDDR